MLSGEKTALSGQNVEYRNGADRIFRNFYCVLDLDMQ